MTPHTRPSTPAAPTAVLDTGDTSPPGTIAVSWTPPADNGSTITGYTVMASDGTTTQTVCTSSDITCDVHPIGTDPGFLTLGTPYTFTVVATNAVGSSDPSDPSNSVTPSTVPATPATPAASANSDGTVTVTWTAPSNNGSAITGYDLKDQNDNAVCPAATTSTATTCTISGLTLGTEYHFHVAAINGTGTSDFSTESNLVTPATPPSAPTNVVAALHYDSGGTTWVLRSGTKANVTFSGSASANGSAISSYEVSALVDGIIAGHTCTAASSGATPSCNVEGLTPGTTYTFSVTAINIMGASSAVVSAPILVAGAPSPPTMIGAARNGADSLDVSWSPSATTGATPVLTYKVIGRSAGSTPVSCTYVVGTDSGNHCIFNGLTTGVAYTFTGTATNAVFTSVGSNQVVGKPAVGPSAPLNVAVSGVAGGLKVSWSAPASTGGSPITSYKASIAGGTQTCTSAATPTKCTITGLTANQSYTVSVQAFTLADLGYGAASAGVSAYVPAAPSAPTNVGASTGPTKGSIMVTWNAPASNGHSAITSYKVTTSGSSPQTCTVKVKVPTQSAFSCKIRVVPSGHAIDPSATFSASVTATNAIGTSSASAPSPAVHPHS